MATTPRLFSPYDAPMWASIDRRAMELQRCAGCGSFQYPPGPNCPVCLSTELEWRTLSGDGALLSWATFHRQYLPAYPAPHTVVAVQLAEGPITIGHVAPDLAPRLAVGAAMRITYVTHADGYTIPGFALAEGEG